MSPGEFFTAWVLIGWAAAAIALRECFDDLESALISILIIAVDGAVAGPFVIPITVWTFFNK